MITVIAKCLRYACILAGMAFVLLASTSAPAANVFEEQGGRFAVNLPEGWGLTPQTMDTEYVFKGSGYETIIIQYVPNETDVNNLFRTAIATFRQAGIPDAKPDGAIKDMKVNNHPARWGFYKGEYSGNKVKLYGALGAVALKEDGVVFMAILNDASRSKLGKTIEKSFHSARDSGQAVTGVSDIKTVSMDAANDKATEFKHELLSLTLPTGWVSQALPQNFEKEIVGWFKSDRIAGGSVLAICYRGIGSSESSVLKAAKDTVAAGVPGAQMVNVYDVEHEGKKIPVNVYTGANVVQGQQVAMGAVTAVKKTGQCRLAMVGFSQAVGRADMEKDILAMTRSAR